ncbi:hypothetical protein [Gaoshiqia sp. Z1-71]|uniref:hypothetical protein n=1 Tax=Gaoshiqia hydrogeniformans TaxID=3290090 RepID=UPI003BF90096
MGYKFNFNRVNRQVIQASFSLCLSLAVLTAFASGNQSDKKKTVSGAASKNLVVNSDASQGIANWKNVETILKKGGPDKARYFEVENSTSVNSLEFISVDATSQYQLSAMIKSGNDKINNVYVGLYQFDENKKMIASTAVSPVEQTETTLEGNVAKGESVVRVKDASNWEPVFWEKRLTIVFDVDDSGEYKDLPNPKFYTVEKLVKKDGYWEATLAKPLASNFKSGIKVRAHLLSGQYMYVFNAKKNFPEWTKVEGTIEPVVKSGAPRSTFWPGTKYVQVLVLANLGQKDGEVLQFTNISLEKVDTK